ncbi:hypothetical protein Hdeb2414_s0031g00709121 [Helianthus debilis subsp. tardiflorus]
MQHDRLQLLSAYWSTALSIVLSVPSDVVLRFSSLRATWDNPVQSAQGQGS